MVFMSFCIHGGWHMGHSFLINCAMRVDGSSCGAPHACFVPFIAVCELSSSSSSSSTRDPAVLPMVVWVVVSNPTPSVSLVRLPLFLFRPSSPLHHFTVRLLHSLILHRICTPQQLASHLSSSLLSLPPTHEALLPCLHPHPPTLPPSSPSLWHLLLSPSFLLLDSSLTCSHHPHTPSRGSTSHSTSHTTSHSTSHSTPCTVAANLAGTAHATGSSTSIGTKSSTGSCFAPFSPSLPPSCSLLCSTLHRSQRSAAIATEVMSLVALAAEEGDMDTVAVR